MNYLKQNLRFLCCSFRLHSLMEVCEPLAEVRYRHLQDCSLVISCCGGPYIIVTYLFRNRARRASKWNIPTLIIKSERLTFLIDVV